jgi:hypothetical protein
VTLEEIKAFNVPRELVGATEDALREAGTKGYELFVLWSGRIVNNHFSVDHIYVPAQQSYRLEGGPCVQVLAPELDRLNRWLYSEKQVLAAQVHTHPNEAYHSETDDSYPIVTVTGGLSVVVPHFCREEFGSPGIAVFRLTRLGWEQQSKAVVDELIQVIG